MPANVLAGDRDGDRHFQQRIEAGDVLREGDYSKTITFTLSTTSP